jgi:hypothetical protein
MVLWIMQKKKWPPTQTGQTWPVLEEKGLKGQMSGTQNWNEDSQGNF